MKNEVWVVLLITLVLVEQMRKQRDLKVRIWAGGEFKMHLFQSLLTCNFEQRDVAVWEMMT